MNAVDETPPIRTCEAEIHVALTDGEVILRRCKQRIGESQHFCRFHDQSINPWQPYRKEDFTEEKP